MKMINKQKTIIVMCNKEDESGINKIIYNQQLNGYVLREIKQLHQCKAKFLLIFDLDISLKKQNRKSGSDVYETKQDPVSENK